MSNAEFSEYLSLPFSHLNPFSQMIVARVEFVASLVLLFWKCLGMTRMFMGVSELYFSKNAVSVCGEQFLLMGRRGTGGFCLGNRSSLCLLGLLYFGALCCFSVSDTFTTATLWLIQRRQENRSNITAKASTLLDNSHSSLASCDS